MSDEVVHHIHENKDARKDSIEIGTPKNGVIKVYFDANAPWEETQALIITAVQARFYARGAMEGEP